ncbi:MAG TPA: dNTP triphosphohydrolase [Smithellaceae bacterium]|nr:dNTP triphosphohydrolase [Smithellaceae bacterium]
MLDWKKLLNQDRRKDLDNPKHSMGTREIRTEIERDYDRILFAAPTRRLADKTQVFPMEENDSVRNRLTHSHEVSNLARSIGVRLAFDYPEKVFGPNHEDLKVKRNVPALLAAIGLAHDLGNPPFGHQGETAIRQWFREQAPKDGGVETDFLEFDGNAQTFRLLTRLQILNDRYGLNLTVATLAALIKYPSIYGSGGKKGFKKFGIFASEAKIVEQVWEHTGLRAGIRHPLTYVMEACDDIAYSIIDAEDIVKKGYASFYDLMDYLDGTKDDLVSDVVTIARSKNNDFKKEDLSSRELNDISMQMFRVKAIAAMVTAATDVFVEHIKQMMEENLDPGFELIKVSSCNALCNAVKQFDKRYGFQHMDVLRLELQGNSYIKNMMAMMWKSISQREDTNSPFQRYVYGAISENYRRVFEGTNISEYEKRQLLCDVISGMTENYLIKKHDEFTSLQDSRTKNNAGCLYRESEEEGRAPSESRPAATGS